MFDLWCSTSGALSDGFDTRPCKNLDLRLFLSLFIKKTDKQLSTSVALRRGEGYRVPRAQVCCSGPGQAGCMFYFRPISIESSVIFVCVCVPCRPCRGPMSHAATGARFGF